MKYFEGNALSILQLDSITQEIFLEVFSRNYTKSLFGVILLS